MTIENSTITLTFSECVENHARNQQLGEIVKPGEGFSINDILLINKTVTEQGYVSEIYNLKDSLISTNPELSDVVDDANIIVIRNGVNLLLEGDDMIDKLFNEHKVLNHDKKVKMYGRVVNKLARHNLCFTDTAQEPNYDNGEGRIIAFGDQQIKLTTSIRDNLNKLLDSPKMSKLFAEGNYYYDKSICGIGFHGDGERRKVVGIRLGASMVLKYQWYTQSKPITGSKPLELNLNHGDIYVMSEKAAGTDWKFSSKYTLRHSAGCPKFTKL